MMGERYIGDVWRKDWTSKKPWAVQGPGAIAFFKTKKEAKHVSELFKKFIDEKLEWDKINDQNII